MKQFATPLGMSTLSDDLWDEIMGHANPDGGWDETENFLYYTSRVNGESTLTTTGEAYYYQKRSGGKILQHVFDKESWNRMRAWEYLEGLAEKVLKGGEYSGHHGHSGRPGEIGGSLPGISGMSTTSLNDEFNLHRQNVLSAVHTVEDIKSGKVKVGVEGRGGKDIQEAKEAGLYTTVVRNVPIYASVEENAQPLVRYLEAGGKYGTLEFSKLLGYTDIEIAEYTRFLEVQDELERRGGLVTKSNEAVSIKLQIEEMDNPVKLAELEDDDLVKDHEQLHELLKEWEDGEHRDRIGFEDLLKAHSFVVAELEKRGKKCEYDDELAKAVEKSLYKGLIPTLKELQSKYEGFIIWDGYDEPVKIMIKGGPGSGNIGHAGRAGIWGESDAMSGYGTMLRGIEGWPELSDDKKKEWAGAANGVPDSHIEGLAEVRIDDPYLDSERASGMYLPHSYGEKNTAIVLHSQGSTGTTIGHELGHHVSETFLIREDRDTIYRDFTEAIRVGEVHGTVDALRVVGLRAYSLRNSGEFWADSYSIWARANQGNKECKRFQEVYRDSFSETAKLLDGIFE